jgi:GntR family transcriptional regulator, transcriptional repressor for pyruvate dehydrogenase complex
MNIDAPVVLKRDSLSSQVTRHLLDLIAHQGLKPGDLAPSEVQLCQDLKVSRGTVREAYRSLAALGFVEIESGKWHVRGLNPSVLTQVIGFGLRTANITAPQVLQLRRAIEIQAVQLAAQFGTERQFEVLKDCVAAMSAALGDHKKLIAADVAFHSTLAEATHNPLFALLIQGLRESLEDSMGTGLRSMSSREGIASVPAIHQSIVQRICARDQEGSAKAMAHHFDVPVTAILEAGLGARKGRLRVG